MQASWVMLFASLMVTGAAAQLQRGAGPGQPTVTPGEGPPPKAGPAAPLSATTDFLEAVNETTGTVKLELFPVKDPATRARLTACLKPRETMRWPLDRATAAGKLRLQAMRGDQCDDTRPATCTREVIRAPGMQFIALRGACEISPMPAPLRAMPTAGQPCGPSGHWAPLTIVNRDSIRAMWITIYENVARQGGPPILAAACWLPNEARMACVDKRSLIVRAEMVSRNGYEPAKHCADGGVSCDYYAYRGAISGALVDMGRHPGGYTLTMEPRGWGCGLEPWAD